MCARVVDGAAQVKAATSGDRIADALEDALAKSATLFYRMNPIDERLCIELDETKDQYLSEVSVERVMSVRDRVE
jgi:hypothetical protein